MAIKIYCDICFKEPSEDFLLEGTIIETVIPFDSQNLNPQKRLTRRQIHICKICYEKFIYKHIEVKK